ncbi:DUF6622 family protein [Pseudoalteromonas arctica]|uniref:DUF1453 domain-containing protein n=1 Tax=Pseudoalteromonas arctica TaxID=394751 RepID=A0A7Y0DU66_9GAMM|nr:DUF6622 family protein [Pseudoalteromonas arctica]NMM41697.1 hypothetical protein [Pseudoalteromonas arctica]
MIIEILAHTPKWVFGLFIFLAVLGFQQSKERTVKKYLILPLPIGMVFLSYFGVSSSFGLSLTPIGLWFFALACVAILVAKYLPVKDVQFNVETESFNITGSWIPFVLMMAIFFTKYFVGVLNALQPTVVSNPVFIIVCSLIYGAFSGVFVARAISTWRIIGLQPVARDA